MNIFIRRTTLIIIFSTECGTMSAQLDVAKYELGLSGSAFVYQGDLTPSRLGSYRTVQPGFEMYVNRIVGPLFSFRTNIAFGYLKGDDSKYPVPEYRSQRNFYFQTPVLEISELLVADVLKNNIRRQPSRLSPYLFAGVGLTFVKISRDWSRFNAEYFSTETSTLAGLAEDAQHSLPKTIPIIPVGVGIRYSVSKRISINAETSYRWTFTDYLDGFSKAADAAQRDSYQTHSIGIIYQFSKINTWWKCPVPKY